MKVERGSLWIRPMLSLSSAEINSHAARWDIPNRFDSSNLDLRFTRNRIRAELIPMLSAGYNPNLTATLCRTAQLMQEEDDYLCTSALEAVDRVAVARTRRLAVLDVERLLGYHMAIRRRVIRSVLGALAASEGPFDFDRVAAVLATAEKGSGNPLTRARSGSPMPRRAVVHSAGGEGCPGC